MFHYQWDYKPSWLWFSSLSRKELMSIKFSFVYMMRLINGWNIAKIIRKFFIIDPALLPLLTVSIHHRIILNLHWNFHELYRRSLVNITSFIITDLTELAELTEHKKWKKLQIKSRRAVVSFNCNSFYFQFHLTLPVFILSTMKIYQEGF